MHGMQRGNAGLALGSLGAGAASAMELALLRFAVFEGRTATLLARSATVRGASAALNLPPCSCKKETNVTTVKYRGRQINPLYLCILGSGETVSGAVNSPDKERIIYFI